MDICNNKENCDITSTSIYKQIKNNYKNEELNQITDSINNSVKQAYQKTNQSLTIDNNDCSNVTDKYKYSKRNLFENTVYEDENYISIEYRAYEVDLCKQKTTSTPPEIYIFSKKLGRTISQDEFKKELKISTEKIDEYIEKYIDIINSSEQNSLQKYNKNTQAMLYYDTDGQLAIYFHQADNIYQTFNIDELTE